MKGDFQVLFCEGLKLKCFGLLDGYKISHLQQYLFVGINPIDTSFKFDKVEI